MPSTSFTRTTSRSWPKPWRARYATPGSRRPHNSGFGRRTAWARRRRGATRAARRSLGVRAVRGAAACARGRAPRPHGGDVLIHRGGLRRRLRSVVFAGPGRRWGGGGGDRRRDRHHRAVPGGGGATALGGEPSRAGAEIG